MEGGKMAGETSMRRMVNEVLDSQFKKASEQERTELLRELVAAIDKRIDELRTTSHERRLALLVELFDDVKPLARHLLWERLVSEIYTDPHRPCTKDVNRKRLEQARKYNEASKDGSCRMQGCSEDGGCC
jgi:hypothetical protein